jgi:hypothetical protein
VRRPLREVAYYVLESPPGQGAVQISDVFVHRDGLVYMTDRAVSGVYILERSSA